MLRNRRLLRVPVLASFLLSGLSAMETWAGCRMVETGRIPLTVESNVLLVNGSINGHPIDILVDTGSHDSFIVLESAKAAGLNPVRDRRYYLQGRVQDSTIYKAKVDRLVIGNTRIEGKQWPVMQIGESGLDLGIGMVLAADFWSKTDYEIDIAGGEIVLWDNAGCGKAALAYWSKEFMLALFREKNSEYPELKAALNGSPVSAVIDTGAATTSVNGVVADRVGFRVDGEDGEPRLSKPGRARTVVGKFERFELGDLTIQNARILVPPVNAYVVGIGSLVRGASPSEANISLGVDFLSANRVLVSNNQGYLYMTYNGGRVFQTNVSDMASAEKHLSEGRVEASEYLSKSGGEAFLRGSIAYRKQQYVEAEPDLRVAYDELQSNGHLETQPGRDALAMLSRTLVMQDRNEEALPLLQEYVRIEERISGPTHRNLAYGLTGLAGAYMSQHKYAEALATMEKAHPLIEQLHAPDSPEYMEFLLAYGTTLEGSADYVRAEEMYGRAMAIAAREPEPDQRNVARALINVGRMQESQERYQEALRSYQRAREIYATLPNNTEFLDFADRVIKDVQEAATR